MDKDGKLGILERSFISGPQDPDKFKRINFEKFDDAKTINVAVTGDMPPLDYIGEDGRAAGFNTAILSEIGHRLKVNINLVNIETGARAIALKSGRADVVFWFQMFSGDEKLIPDIPDGVIVSMPYYRWNRSMMIGKAAPHN